jgi:excinuclease ABC subunit C
MPSDPWRVVARLPAEPGVYRFRDEHDRVLYVGRAVDLRRRVGSYRGDLRDRRHLAPMVKRIARIEALVCASAHEAWWLERNLLERYLPPWNRTRGGQEVPVFIQLDTSTRSAGLRLIREAEQAREQGRVFGPYLGGRRVRLAIAALRRVYPICYSGDGLTSAERDLARLRRVGPADRAEIASALTAVLDRRPDAVRALCARLAELRDAAASDLAFERAGQLHEEIAAIRWIMAPQQVTGLERYDLDVAGWAAGVLVRFEIRGGALGAWHQEPSPDKPPAEPAATTPARWITFADRNAHLAAALAP